MFKKIVSLMMAFLMLFTFPLNVFAQTNDYANHWANNTIEKWKTREIVKGYEDGSFRPENAITRAEFAQIMVRIFGYTDISDSKNYLDVTADDWFYNAVNLISNAKLMYDFNEKEFRPNEEITREEAIYAMAKAYKVAGKSDKKFNDDSKISEWAKESVNAMYSKGYINGTPAGDVMPKDSLTRAELLTIIDNTIASLINEKGTYQEDVEGNLVVNTSDVELKDMTISGNLYLAEGIGEGNITLDNITVKGNVVVEGGGENSIKSNNSKYNNSFIINAKNPVRVVINGDAVKVEALEYANTTLSGNFSEIIVYPNANVKLVDAKVDKIHVVPANSGSSTNEQSSAKITIDEKSTVTNITADSAVSVEGKGTISELIVNVDGVTVEQKVKSVKIAEGIQAEVGGKLMGNVAQGGGAPSLPPAPDPGPVDPEPEVVYVTRAMLAEKLIASDVIKGILNAPTQEDVDKYSNQITDWGNLTDNQQEAVSWILKNRILISYEDGTFRGDVIISRAELTAIVCKALNISIKNSDTDFGIEDIEKHWAKDLIITFVKLGLADGIYESPKFNPDDLTKLEDLTKVVSNMEKYINENEIVKPDDKYYVSGVVLDAEGNPQEDVQVRMFWSDYSRQIVYTDFDGKFVFEIMYVDSKHNYTIEADYLDENSYGYSASISIPAITSDIEDLELILEKTPVTIYSAVDKYDVAMNGVYVLSIETKEFIAFISNKFENAGNVTFNTDYNNDKYLLRIIQAGDIDFLFLSDGDIERNINVVDDFKTEIKITLKNYGLDETTLAGKVESIDGMPMDNIVIKLCPMDKYGRPIDEDIRYTTTDEDGNYTFEDIDTKNFSYEIEALDPVYHDGAYYNTVKGKDIRIDKDIDFIKSYSIIIKVVDKNNVAINNARVGVMGEGFFYGVAIIENENSLVYTNLDLKPEKFILYTSMRVDGKYYYTSKIVNIEEGNYAPYECILKYDDYEVPQDELVTISGNVEITTGGAITILENVDVKISLISNSGKVLKTITSNLDGSFIIENIRINERYKIIAETVYDGKKYYYCSDYFRAEQNEITHDILLEPVE